MRLQKKGKILKIAIIVLAILLIISLGGLAARYIYLEFYAPYNVTVERLEYLTGDDTKPDSNKRFEAKNMFPGDVVTQNYSVKATHGSDMKLCFRTDIIEQTLNYSDVLHIKVTNTDTGTVICDTALSEADGKVFSDSVSAGGDNVTSATYRIEISLDESAGNEYQAASLKADFEWYIDNKGDAGTVPPVQNDGGRDAVTTVLWIVPSVSLILLVAAVILFAVLKRRGEA